MADRPVVVQDQITVSLRRHSQQQTRLLGDRILNRSPRHDRDRLRTAQQEQWMCDPVPLQPLHKQLRWKVRNRSNEVGPPFRLDSTLQVQRVYDKLQATTGKYFTNDPDYTESKSRQRNDTAMKTFVKTGLYDFDPLVNPADYPSETDLKNALKRERKIHQTDYVLPPRNLISGMHQKTYF